ncbi:MAG: hypothetical protein R3E97_04500 [Candidatus Eisenbacteria bacterium]
MLGCLFLLGAPPPALAADNSAYGGIRELNNGTLLGGDGTGTAKFTIHSVRLDLVKQARDLNGTLLPSGGSVDAGSEIYFVLIVDNPTLAPASDIRLSDPINRDAFVYQPGSLEMSVVPTGSDPMAGPWTPLTDELDPVGTADLASITTSVVDGIDRLTFGADPEQTNLRYDLEAGHQLVVRFRVRVK